MKISSKLRYPGVKPFSKEEKVLFFGRDEDTSQLKKIIHIEPLSVLYGKSGLGKSSLLLAGIIPELEDEGYECHYLRFGSFNQYSDSPIFRLGDALGEASAEFSTLDDTLQQSVWVRLKTREMASSKPQVLIFDQFEELFTYAAEEVAKLEKALAQLLYMKPSPKIREQIEQDDSLSEKQIIALLKPLRVRVLIAIRSDRLSQLNRLSGSLPYILKQCYELKPLSRQGAEDAILLPAYHKDPAFATPIFDYSDKALDAMLHFLTEGGRDQVEGFALQVVCQYAEHLVYTNKVDSYKNGIPIIEQEYLGDLQDIYTSYYNDLIAGIGTPKAQQKAHTLIEEVLIFEEEERRISLDEAILTQSMGFSKELLNKLTDSHLLRVEVSSSTQGRTYEISHDSLINPILKAKEERKARIQKQGYRRRMLAVAGVAMMLLVLVGFTFSYRLYTQAQEYSGAYKQLKRVVGEAESNKDNLSDRTGQAGEQTGAEDVEWIGVGQEEETPATKLLRLSKMAAERIDEADQKDSILQEATQVMIAKLKKAEAGSRDEQRLAAELLQVLDAYKLDSKRADNEMLAEIDIPEAILEKDIDAEGEVSKGKDPAKKQPSGNGSQNADTSSLENPTEDTAAIQAAEERQIEENRYSQYKERAWEALGNRRYRVGMKLLDRMIQIKPQEDEAKEMKQQWLSKLVPQMVKVEGGRFVMGCEQETEDCKPDELPNRKVLLSDFSMSQFEITNQQFVYFLNDVIYDPERPLDSRAILNWLGINEVTQGIQSPLVRVRGRFTIKKGYENHPVMYISWVAARAYCKWLSLITKENYRLPTEAEWEYAAKGGNKAKNTIYAGGNDYNAIAWHLGNASKPQRGTRAVGEKVPNELGLYDMSGNVWEWCLDYYGKYPASGEQNPSGANRGEGRVIRGGSWLEGTTQLRVAYRGYTYAASKKPSIGFRCVKR